MNIGVIGCGQMGTGLVQVLASTDKVNAVTWLCRDEKSYSKSINKIQLELEKIFKKGNLPTTPNEAIEKINFLKLSDVNIRLNFDFVIEAISECVEVKKSVISYIAPYLTDECIIGSNTSSISISEIATCTATPSNVIGMHFFNPAPLMKLVEITAGERTSESCTNKAVEFAKSIGKEPIILRESPGFVVNRMLIPMINEAIQIYSEGVASRDDIDKAMKLGANHPMGPLALSDFIGNDVVLSIMDVLHKETGDQKYRAASLLRKMVRAKKLGRKTKEGFYNY